MFIRYNDYLCLNDWNDVIEIKCDSGIGGFVITLELKPDEVVYIQDDITKAIPVKLDDLILITVRQGRVFSDIDSVDAELYIKKADEIVLIIGCSILEKYANIKALKAYEMFCYLAKRIGAYYNVSWKYMDNIDAPEKVKPNKQSKLIKVLAIVIWVIFILRLILNFIH
jgi:hypothetical protein